jgi:hypothetical protein
MKLPVGHAHYSATYQPTQCRASREHQLAKTKIRRHDKKLLTNRDCKTGLADGLVLPVLLPSGFYFEIQFFYLCKLIAISFRFNVFT